MSDMHEPDVHLTGAAFLEDFDRYFWRSGTSGFWKLERRQVFQEPTDDSWVAFSEGRWDQALRLLEARRPALEGYYQRIAAAGFTTRRVRVVEQPLTPYLRWELHLLRLRHQLGGRVRVVGPERVKPLEQHGPLPELITLGDEAGYVLDYDEQGLQEGGTRFTDPATIAHWRSVIAILYADGEDLNEYFQREVSP